MDNGKANIFIEGGWRTPEEFARAVCEAIAVSCSDEETKQTIALILEKLNNGEAI